MRMENKQRQRSLAPLLVVLAGACWGLIGLFTNGLAEAGFSPLQTVFLRFCGAAILIWLYLLLFDREKLKMNLRDLWLFLGTGVLSLALFSLLYFTTIRLTTLSFAAVLLYTAPSFVMLLSAVFFGERIGSKKLIALALAFFGCVCTTGLLPALVRGAGFAGLPLLGILTGVGSGLGYALYSIFGTAALKKYDTVTVTAYTFLTAALALLPFCARGEFFALLAAPGAFADAAGIILVSTLLPYLLYTQGLRATAPGTASVLAFSEPLVATAVGLLAFGETLSLGAAVGMCLIFLSILIVNSAGRKRRRR